jgi:MaoC dehydratase-like protein
MTVDLGRALKVDLEPITVAVERRRLVSFARAIGETDPIYTDVAAAQRAGHPDLPAPPTFLYGLEFEAPEPFGYLERLDVDLRRVLHGGQSFTYSALAYAGDSLILQPRLVDAYSKKDGALQFLVKRTEIFREGRRLAEATTTLVIRASEVLV